MKRIKRIALVAHDNRKNDLVAWVEWNWEELLIHKMVCTGTTGKMVEQALMKKIDEECPTDYKLEILKLKSGPLGGDQQLGAMRVRSTCSSSCGIPCSPNPMM
jgi:methylglyoxal synthase